jgi:hypothetical protein
MAASSWNPKNARILTDAGGGIAPVYEFPEGSSQSYKAGALVYLDATNGYITACAASATKIAGIAMQDASTTLNTRQNVQIIRPGDRMTFLCFDDSDDAEVAANTLKPGFTYDIEVDSGVSYAEHDSENATSEELIFIQAVYDSTGTSTNWGIFQIEATALNFGHAA